MIEDLETPDQVDPREILVGLFDILLKIRILRKWQQSSRARGPEYSDRDVLILELVGHFSPTTEGELRSVFGLAPSSVSEAVKKLVVSGLLDKSRSEESDQRLRPLALTPKGETVMKAVRDSAASRYAYLFSELDVAQLASLGPVLKDIDKAATREIRRRVFDEYV